MTTKSKTKNEQTFETTVEVCCHQVALRYWGFKAPLTDELKESLTEAGEERAQECIIQGCGGGELNYVYRGEEEIRGWWEIERD